MVSIPVHKAVQMKHRNDMQDFVNTEAGDRGKNKEGVS